MVTREERCGLGPAHPRRRSRCERFAVSVRGRRPARKAMLLLLRISARGGRRQFPFSPVAFVLAVTLFASVVVVASVVIPRCIPFGSVRSSIRASIPLSLPITSPVTAPPVSRRVGSAVLTSNRLAHASLGIAVVRASAILISRGCAIAPGQVGILFAAVGRLPLVSLIRGWICAVAVLYAAARG